MIDSAPAIRSYRKRRYSMRTLKTLLLSLLLVHTLPMFGAAYIKFDGVDGESTAAGHEKWIELGSLQYLDGTPATGMLSSGRVRVSSSSGVNALVQLCQSRRPLGNVQLDLHGTRQVLQNVRFVECPVVRGGVATFVLEHGDPSRKGQKTAGYDLKVNKAAVHESSTAQRGNTTMTGLGRMPWSLDIRRASLAGNVATIALKAGTVTQALGAALMEASAKGTVIPVLTLESAGQKWSFTNVLFSSVQYSQTQDTVVSFQFQSMNGSAAAFQALGN
jgi:hypothetical protein